ncbi:MAG TPA: hypothetical protein VLH15_02950 [Dehalococcoidales bacterium]|nr:hypothetical protein [Dehalococcoidales bacterium]
MLAQVILTPAESKKLIAKAIASLDEVKKAFREGMVVMHPSSSTYFILEELTGKKPATNFWVCGVVTPRGNCVEMAMLSGGRSPSAENYNPGDLRGQWAIQQGRVLTEIPLSDLLDQMTERDVYIKGVNALDVQGNIGILIGEPVKGGGLGLVLAAWRKKKFSFIYPAGLEKLIPVSIAQAAKEARRTQFVYGMGLPAGLYPCPEGKTITEIKAVEILSGAEAVPVAAGGLGGAEGAVTLIIKGSREQVNLAINVIEGAKGAKLPPLRLCNCTDCPVPDCRFPVGDKHWV